MEDHLKIVFPSHMQHETWRFLMNNVVFSACCKNEAFNWSELIFCGGHHGGWKVSCFSFMSMLSLCKIFRNGLNLSWWSHIVDCWNWQKFLANCCVNFFCFHRKRYFMNIYSCSRKVVAFLELLEIYQFSPTQKVQICIFTRVRLGQGVNLERRVNCLIS